MVARHRCKFYLQKEQKEEQEDRKGNHLQKEEEKQKNLKENAGENVEDEIYEEEKAGRMIYTRKGREKGQRKHSGKWLMSEIRDDSGT